MTSVSYRQDSTAAGSGGSGRGEIVHFDATVRRKEKMRQLAGQEAPVNGGPAPTGGLRDSGKTSLKTAQSAGLAQPATVEQPARVERSTAPVAPVVPAKDATSVSARPAVAATGSSVVPTSPVPPQPVAASKPAGRSSSSAVNAAAPATPAQDRPAAAGRRAVDFEELETVLVNFVVEQTGYPPEMVELDADLEADLGIDSIKKAQMLGELAEQLDVQITISEDMSLDDFPTLRHITDFLKKASSGTPSAAVEPPSAVIAPPAAPNGARRDVAAVARMETPATVSAPVARSSSPATAQSAASFAELAPAESVQNAVASLNMADLEQFLVNFVVEQTGYPPEMVELDADLEADLGIDSIKKAQLFGELAEQLNIQIQITEDMSLDQFPTLRHVLNALGSAAAKASGPDAAASSAPSQALAPGTSSAAPVRAAAVVPVSTDATSRAAVAPVAAVAASAAVAETGAGQKLAVASLNPAELEAFLVNFVVEQTGYPPEMVELDADLEADLGIDSIKKAQLFGELAENLDVQIQITEDMSLDNYRTLRDVLNLLVQDRR